MCVNAVIPPPWKSSDARAGLLDAVIVCKRHFNHSGSHQMLVQDCLDAGNLGKRHFNHRGSLQKLAQYCLDAGNVCKPTWTSPEAAAGQFKYLKVSKRCYNHR